MREVIGMVLMIFGTVTADNERLIVPLALMGIGLWLVRGVVQW